MSALKQLKEEKAAKEKALASTSKSLASSQNKVNFIIDTHGDDPDKQDARKGYEKKVENYEAQKKKIEQEINAIDERIKRASDMDLDDDGSGSGSSSGKTEDASPKTEDANGKTEDTNKGDGIDDKNKNEDSEDDDVIVKREAESEPVLGSVERHPPGPGDKVKFSVDIDDEDDEDDEILLRNDSRDGADSEMKGERISHAWKRAGGARTVGIVSYGPRNARAWRREAGGRGGINVTDPQSRRGEQHEYDDDGNKIWNWTNKSVKGIVGVALPANTKKENILDAVDPSKKADYFDEKRQRTIAGRFEPADVILKWEDNEITYETRAAFDRLWKDHKPGAAGRAIFRAARRQEERYGKWKTGEIKSKDMSPTPDPSIMEDLRNNKSLTPEPPKNARKDEATAADKGKGKGKETGTVSEQELEEIQKKVATLKIAFALGLGTKPDKMSRTDKMDFAQEIQERFPQLSTLAG